ncbi:MAG: hypothetical protein LBU51_07720 [Bacteroidales bacterium]|jgi:hypothetical protein|nr:hypothetical protein [Bacteroidales bacterium]
MDYTIFYKDFYDSGDLDNTPKYDIFLSAFDNCNRTKEIFNKVNSTQKRWFLLPQYKKIEEFPTENIYNNESLAESEYFEQFIQEFSENDYKSKKICIDITGFIRPHLIYLLKFLSCSGMSQVDLLYTEPVQYKNADETKFSGYIDRIQDVEGCSSINNNPNTENDLLIICAGYDDDLIAKIAQNKGHCQKKYYILGFPSLQPDFYQESILKMENAKQSTGEFKKVKFAPAFDPFVTAQIINEIVEENPDATNIYLSPLSTKPQTVGMALFYITNYDNLPVSIIFPYSKTYTSKHAEGIKRTWKYTVEFTMD